MSGFAKDFEELEIYILSREIVIEIYKLTQRDNFRKDYELVNQIRRAGISIMSNIAEGFDRGSKKEFILFLNYAKGSNGEVRAQIEVAKEIGYITIEEYEGLREKVVKNGRMISNFIKSIKMRMK